MKAAILASVKQLPDGKLVMGMSGVVRKRSKMVADEVDEVPYLVGEEIGWVRECDVMKWWNICDNGLLRSDMSMLKSPHTGYGGDVRLSKCQKRLRAFTWIMFRNLFFFNWASAAAVAAGPGFFSTPPGHTRRAFWLLTRLCSTESCQNHCFLHLWRCKNSLKGA